MFIVLESVDGGGKGRQREEVEEYFKDKKIKVKTMEFPDHSTSIWENYLHPALHGEIELTPGAWFSAFAFEKFLWQEELNKYKGDPNNLFIADGYYTTTLVYQCIIQKNPSLDFGIQFADELGIVKPDLSIYLDVHPRTAMARKEKEEGKEEKDMFEQDLEKQVFIQAAFLEMVEKQTWCKWKQVDGNGSIPEVRDSVLAEINSIWSGGLKT